MQPGLKKVRPVFLPASEPASAPHNYVYSRIHWSEPVDVLCRQIGNLTKCRNIVNAGHYGGSTGHPGFLVAVEHRWASSSVLMSAISDIDICYSDIGKNMSD
jgi:hypothetical protein